MAHEVPPGHARLAAQFEALGFDVSCRSQFVAVRVLGQEWGTPPFVIKEVERDALLVLEEDGMWCIAVGFVAIVDDTTVLPEAEVVPFVSRILSSKEAFETEKKRRQAIFAARRAQAEGES